MNDHQLGVRLRHQIVTDLERGVPSDGRRLQALAGDLCGEEQRPLLPALRYLVMSPAFSSAAGQTPPLPADARLLLRLQQELDQVFTTAICQRMAAVLRGLLGLPEACATPLSPPAEPMPIPAGEDPADWPMAQPVREPTPVDRAAAGSNQGVVAVLGFMAGVLVVGVLGALGWLVLVNRQPQLEAPIAGSKLPSEPTAASANAESAISQPPPAPDLGQQANTDLAIASVQQLYTDISSGNLDAARQLFSPSAADQFDPSFFSQFQQVSVSDLRETNRSGSSVTLSGVVTFVYPDNTTQSESRSFTVDTSSQPALITGSSFGAVLKPRG